MVFLRFERRRLLTDDTLAPLPFLDLVDGPLVLAVVLPCVDLILDVIDCTSSSEVDDLPLLRTFLDLPECSEDASLEAETLLFLPLEEPPFFGLDDEEWILTTFGGPPGGRRGETLVGSVSEVRSEECAEEE